MKKILIILMALVFLTGFSVADHTMPPVPETQGIVTSTTIDAVGNFASVSEIQWRITNDEEGLNGIPPLNQYQDENYNLESIIFESTYSEDTFSSGIGLIAYDKELDMETSGQVTGLWNIEAVKELSFIGVDGARVMSTDNIFVDGIARSGWTNTSVMCPFAADVTEVFPAFCNMAEAGSSIDMTVANVRTTSTDRFVRPAADYTVELNHDILVTELVEDLPSMGMASAYMDVLIQEAYGGDAWVNYIYLFNGERIEYSESTSVNGDISLFEKLMHYESGMVR
jgi:hypothetical protein